MRAMAIRVAALDAGFSGKRVGGDALQRDAHTAHCGHHVAKLQPDSHVDLPDPRMPFDVRFVVRTSEQLAEPHLQRCMEAPRLGFVLEHRERARVHAG